LIFELIIWLVIININLIIMSDSDSVMIEIDIGVPPNVVLDDIHIGEHPNVALDETHDNIITIPQPANNLNPFILFLAISLFCFSLVCVVLGILLPIIKL
jgi:hypothetical protein